MPNERVLPRRSFLMGVAAAAAGLIGCTRGVPPTPRASGTRSTGSATSGPVQPVDCPALQPGSSDLWQVALERGLVYGSSTTTWQIADQAYAKLFAREVAILFTEDDLLWWRLRPTPDSGLTFGYADQIVDFAEKHGILVLGAHLVWDQGFGKGWQDSDLWNLSTQGASDLIYSTIDHVVGRYRGRVSAWIVVNEAIDAFGLRTETPWYSTIGPSYVADSFRRARDADPGAVLVLNDYGYETDDRYTKAADKRAATLEVLDQLLNDHVPVDALGVQAHLHANDFGSRFDRDAYQRFLSDVTDRGLKVLITEMDVLDDGLPAETGPRDRAVAGIYRTYLDTALAEPWVSSLTTFGLSDRYTWLQEDYPRRDGAARRPLPFDEALRPKPAFHALEASLASAAPRNALWAPPRC